MKKPTLKEEVKKLLKKFLNEYKESSLMDCGLVCGHRDIGRTVYRLGRVDATEEILRLINSDKMSH